MISALGGSRLASSVRLHAAAPDIAKGVRAAVVMLAPFYLARVLGRPELAWTAIGGWLCTLADPGGVRATRARALLAFASVGTLLVGVSETLAGSAWTAALVLAVATFVLSMLQAGGGAAARVGTLLAMTTAIACARARTTPLRDALFFGMGALAAAVLSSVVWPVWTHLPVRRAVAAAYGALAAYASEVERAVGAGLPAGDARWSEMVRHHHRRIRDAIEAARAIAVAVRARRVGETRLGSNLRALLGAAEAQFPLVATVAQEVEGLEPEARGEAGVALGAVVADDREVERVLVTRVIRAGVSGANADRRTESGVAAQPVLQRLGAASRSARDLAHAVDATQPDLRALPGSAGDPAPYRPSVAGGAWARALRDAFTLRSTTLRHAVRAACAALVASFLGSAVAPHQYWVTLATLAILQPFPGATVKRAVERVIGTILGSALAILIMGTIRSPFALSALLFPLSIAAVATRSRSYRLFTLFLTPVFVVLAERRVDDWPAAVERAEDAILGGAVALAVGLLVFPETERERLPEKLVRMLEALAAYAARVLDGGGAARASGVAGGGNATARRAVGIAFGDAEASLERYLSEPRRDPASSADAMLLVTYSRRLATALTALDTLGGPEASQRVVGHAVIATYVRGVIERAIARVRGEACPPAAEAPGVPAPVTATDSALIRVLEWAALIAGLGVAASERADGEAPGQNAGATTLGDENHRGRKGT